MRTRFDMVFPVVIPAKAGIQASTRGSAEKTHVAADAAPGLDSRLRGNDDEEMP